MTRSKIAGALAFALLVCLLAAPAQAVQVDSGDVYCFSGSDFTEDDRPLAGICLTELPQGASGAVMLGTRVLRPGDILTAEQVAQMTFSPAATQEDQQAQVCYLPIFQDRVEQEAVMTISIRGKEDKAPTAEDSSLETYKNLEAPGKLKTADPEGETLTFTLVRRPRRGDVTIGEDGSFTYTPKKNKVGTDSFTYTAADPGGNVSREATVTITIRKPTDNRQYSDTAGTDCSFSAEWLRQTGIFTGEQLRDRLCFHPDQAVSRGEFLAMVMDTLKMKPDAELTSTGFSDEAPKWLKPYLAAAMRSGLVSGYPGAKGVEFRPAQPITEQEAAVMLQNALNLPTPTAYSNDPAAASWAAGSVAAVRSCGMALEEPQSVLTRGDAAGLLYAAWNMQ